MRRLIGLVVLLLVAAPAVSLAGQATPTPPGLAVPATGGLGLAALAAALIGGGLLTLRKRR